MKPTLFPPRQPKGKRWLYCRVCDLDVLQTERLQHDEEPDHVARLRSIRRELTLDRMVPSACPGTTYFFAPWAALIDNILYDAASAAAQGRRMDRGVSPAARSGR